MTSSQHQEIQQLVDDHIGKLTAGHPDIIGAAVGWISPDTGTGGDKVFSSPQVKCRNGDLVDVKGDTPFYLASVSKVFTTGIYEMLQDHHFGGSVYDLLDPPLRDQISQTVQEIPIQCLAAYTSGFAHDNGDCKTPWVKPSNLTDSLTNFFDYLGVYGTPGSKYQQAYAPGKMYSYSNLANALLLMAAINLDSLNDEDFLNKIQSSLSKYCQCFSGDATTYYEPMTNKDSLPFGYTLKDDAWTVHDHSPLNLVEYGYGGIVSNGDDMLKFLQYCMSSSYPADLQGWYFEGLRKYCNPDETTDMLGYGWVFPYKQIGGDWYIIQSRSGKKQGFTSWIALDANDGSRPSKWGFFVLMNGPGATDLGEDVLNVIFPAEAATPVQKNVEPAGPEPIDPSIQ